MSFFTILGARGFIGSHLAAALARQGHDVFAPPRDANLQGRDLGHVIYAIGITADFRTRPFDTVTAHVGKLQEVLRDGRFDSLTYLSSTRVYQGLAGPVDESSEPRVDSTRPDDLYNLSKLLGESLALNCGRPTKVARLSNVYGYDPASENFLSSVLHSAVTAGTVSLRTAAASVKDYVSIGDVVSLLPRIALAGRERIYNVASGTQVTHAQLAARLAALTDCDIHVASGSTASVFPKIDIARVAGEFDFRPALVLDDLPALIANYRQLQEPSACL